MLAPDLDSGEPRALAVAAPPRVDSVEARALARAPPPGRAVPAQPEVLGAVCGRTAGRDGGGRRSGEFPAGADAKEEDACACAGAPAAAFGAADETAAGERLGRWGDLTRARGGEEDASRVSTRESRADSARFSVVIFASLSSTCQHASEPLA